MIKLKHLALGITVILIGALIFMVWSLINIGSELTAWQLVMHLFWFGAIGLIGAAIMFFAGLFGVDDGEG